MLDTIQILVDAIRQLGPTGLAVAAVGGFATESGAELFRQTKLFLTRMLANDSSTIEALGKLSLNPHDRIAKDALIYNLRHKTDITRFEEEAKQLSTELNKYWKTDAGRQINAKNYIERLEAHPGSTINIS